MRHYLHSAINDAVADMLVGKTIKTVLQIGTPNDQQLFLSSMVTLGLMESLWRDGLLRGARDERGM